MNPFYAPDFQSLQMSPMRAALEPMPLYQPRSSGYMGIYGTQPAPSRGVASVMQGMSSPMGDSGGQVGEGARDNPAAAGGTATTNSFGQFAGAALSAANPMMAALSILGQMAFNPDKQPTNPSLLALGQSAYDAAFGNPFGGPGGQNVNASPTLGGVSDYDIQANDMAGVAGAASAMGGMSSSTPGADTLGDTGMYAEGGYVPGKSGGMDDDVPAIIDEKEPARLSSGEFVFDAATVAALGDGNNAAGAKKLDGLRKAIRKKAYGHEKQPPKNYSVGDLVRAYDRGR